MSLLNNHFREAESEFQSAAQANKTVDIGVKIVLTLSYLNQNWSPVTYAEGTLYYHPGSAAGGLYTPESFSSKPKLDLTAYYSWNRGLGSTPLLDKAPNPNGPPFDHSLGMTGLFSATIRGPLFGTNFSMTVHALTPYKWDIAFDLINDDNTGFYTGSYLYQSFITVGIGKSLYVSP